MGTSLSFRRYSGRPLTRMTSGPWELVASLSAPLVWETESWETELGEGEPLVHAGSPSGKPRVNSKDHFRKIFSYHTWIVCGNSNKIRQRSSSSYIKRQTLIFLVNRRKNQRWCHGTMPSLMYSWLIFPVRGIDLPWATYCFSLNFPVVQKNTFSKVAGWILGCCQWLEKRGKWTDWHGDLISSLWSYCCHCPTSVGLSQCPMFMVPVPHCEIWSLFFNLPFHF